MTCLVHTYTIIALTRAHLYTKVHLYIQQIPTCYGQICRQHQEYKIQRQDTLNYKIKLQKYKIYQKNCKGVFTIIWHRSCVVKLQYKTQLFLLDVNC